MNLDRLGYVFLLSHASLFHSFESAFLASLKLQFEPIKTFLIRTLFSLMVLSRIVPASILGLLLLNHPLLRFPVHLKRSLWSNQLSWHCDPTRQDSGLNIFSECPPDGLFRMVWKEFFDWPCPCTHRRIFIGISNEEPFATPIERL